MRPRATHTFVEQLAELRFADWIAIGRRAAASKSDDAPTRARLDAIIACHVLAIDAWFARDDVDTLIYLATPRRPRPPRHERRLITIARDAAGDAALACLASHRLSSDDADKLYAPFESLGDAVESANLPSYSMRSRSRYA